MQKGLTPKGKIITGYKMTNKDMTCRGFQFELKKWYEHDGKIGLCQAGFHFCEYPSGVWAYYSEGRLFKIEAEYAILSDAPGADLKHVAKKIRLVEEIEITGDENTGNENTGNENTGDENTGNWNTGNWNTGNRNTGNENTGNWNTGDRNTGNWNTGNWNTGNRNTGNENIGNWNTGDGNCCNFSSGFFNTEEQLYIFDKKYDGKREDLSYKLINSLSYALSSDEPFDYSRFLDIPNASVEKIEALHKKHSEARAALKENK